MHITKWIGIWLAAMLAVFFLVNTAGGLLLNFTAGKVLAEGMYGYCAKMKFPLQEPTNEKEAKANHAILAVRSLVSDDQLISNGGNLISNFTFGKFVVDETTIFLTPEGEHRFSKGIYILAFNDKGDHMDYILNAVGLIDVKKLAAYDGAGEIQRVLLEHKDATVRLDAYTVNDYEITPAQITVLDAQGAELLTEEFPAEGEIIRGENCRIYNESVDEENTLAKKIGIALSGERKSDRVARKILERGNFEEGVSEKMHYGIMNVTRTFVETKDGYTMIAAYTFDYTQSMMFCIMVLAALTTAIVIIIAVIRHLSRKND